MVKSIIIRFQILAGQRGSTFHSIHSILLLIFQFSRGASRRETLSFSDVFAAALRAAKHCYLEPETTQWNVHIPVLFPKSIDCCCQFPAAGTFHADGMCTFHSIAKIYCRASKIRAARHIPHSTLVECFVLSSQGELLRGQAATDFLAASLNERGRSIRELRSDSWDTDWPQMLSRIRAA